MPDVPSSAEVEATRKSISDEDAATLATAGHRTINKTWEWTQSVIALVVTAAMIYCEVNRIESKQLGNAFVLIIALYFIRTNHTKSSGGDGTR